MKYRAVVVLLGLAALAVAAVFFVQAVRERPTWMLLRRTVLKERVRIPEGEPLDPESVVLSVGADGAIHRDGRASSAIDIRKALGSAPSESKVRIDPVLLELHPEARIRDFRPVLEACCFPGWIHLSLLIDTPLGARAIPFPMPGDEGSMERFFLRGDMHRISKKDDRLRLIVRAEAGGACRVDRLVQDRDLWAVYYPRFDGPPSAPPPWTGPHPPLGAWSMETLRAFLADPRVRALDPRLMLRLEGPETAADAIRCMAELRSVVSEDLLVEVAAPE